MRKHQIIIITLFLLFASCNLETYQCWSRIDALKLYPVVKNKTSEKSTIKGWYHSEFQNQSLNFALEFNHDYCNEHYFMKYEYYWENYPVEHSISITCNKDITNGVDTIKSGVELKECFDIMPYDESGTFRLISILLSEKSTNTYQFDDKYYTFNVSLNTSDSIQMIDSCLIKRF